MKKTLKHKMRRSSRGRRYHEKCESRATRASSTSSSSLKNEIENKIEKA